MKKVLTALILITVFVLITFSSSVFAATSKNDETYKCWNCDVVSYRSESENCSECGWDKCPNCNACYWRCDLLNIRKVAYRTTSNQYTASGLKSDLSGILDGSNEGTLIVYAITGLVILFIGISIGSSRKKR